MWSQGYMIAEDATISQVDGFPGAYRIKLPGGIPTVPSTYPVSPAAPDKAV